MATAQPTRNAETEALERNLDYLKLSFIREHLDDFAKLAAEQHWEPITFLAKLTKDARIHNVFRLNVKSARPIFDFTVPSGQRAILSKGKFNKVGIVIDGAGRHCPREKRITAFGVLFGVPHEPLGSRRRRSTKAMGFIGDN